MGFEAAHLAGGEVGDDYYAAADELFRGVPLGYAGEDLALFVAEVDFEAEELVGFGDALGDEDLGYAEVDFDEVVDGYLGGVRGGGGRGGIGEGCGGRGFGVGRGLDEFGAGSCCSAYLGSGVFFVEGRGAGCSSGVGGVGGGGFGVDGLFVYELGRGGLGGVGGFHVGHDLR